MVQQQAPKGRAIHKLIEPFERPEPKPPGSAIRNPCRSILLSEFVAAEALSIPRVRSVHLLRATTSSCS